MWRISKKGKREEGLPFRSLWRRSSCSSWMAGVFWVNRKPPMEYRLGPAEQEGSHADRGAGGNVLRRPSAECPCQRGYHRSGQRCRVPKGPRVSPATLTPDLLCSSQAQQESLIQVSLQPPLLRRLASCLKRRELA